MSYKAAVFDVGNIEPIEEENPAAVIASTIENTAVGDVFSFTDWMGESIRVERMAERWLILLRNKSYVLPYLNETERLHAMSLVRQYVWKHANLLSLCILPGQANTCPSRLDEIVIREAW